MVIEKEELTELLPHKGKMFLLDRVLSYSIAEHSIETQVDVQSTSMFFDDVLGGVPSYVAFEYMAQSISALSGISGRERNQKPLAGVILSVSDFKTYSGVLRQGAKVDIVARQQEKIDRVFSFVCSASADGKAVADGRLTVMEIEDLKGLGA